VIKIVEGAGGTQHEELRYTLYGEPYIVNWLADINQDGLVDGEDIISFFALWDVGAFGSDTNGDGGVDGDDVIQFLAWWDNGEGAGRTLADNRFGFRGYVWDDHLKLYHVRHRVYDPVPGPAGLRWLQRDPAFFVDGLNLYAYCGGDPVNRVDPLGLEGGPPTNGGGEQGYWRNMRDGAISLIPWPGLFDPAGGVSRWRDLGERSRQADQRRSHAASDANSDRELDAAEAARNRTREDLGQAADLAADAIDLATRTAFPAGDAINGITEAGHRFYQEPTAGNAAAMVLFVFLEAGPGKNPVRVERLSGETVEEAVERAVRSSGGECGKITRRTQERLFEGERIWERPHLMEMDRVDPRTGKTNRELMREGKPPRTDEGEIQLHHIDQQTDTPLMWITKENHKKVDHPHSPSVIDRPEFKKFRERYWMDYERTH
jgi:RHS repeat-associated protein